MLHHLQLEKGSARLQGVSPRDCVGPPRFQANDFVIYDKLGSLNIRVVEQSSIQASLDETLRKETATATVSPKVNIYSATYESGKPFQGPVTVLLKEYTPHARQIGVNELVITDRLQVCFVPLLCKEPFRHLM